MRRKLLALIMTVILALSITACGAQKENNEIIQSESTEQTSEAEISKSKDVSEIDNIVSLAAANTEILVGLGLADKITAADVYSSDTGIDSSVCIFDMQNPDMEKLISMKPDIVFTNEINTDGTNNVYEELTKYGISVVNIPSANSLDDIKSDIKLIAEKTGTSEKGDTIAAEIDKAVEDVKSKVPSQTEKKKVYFEISAAPYCYSFGRGTYLNEIVELCGGENIFAEENGWLSVTEESIIAANPDVIISNVEYDGYDFNEILSRNGWDSISAIRNGKVYQVGANSTGRASQNIVDGIYEIAEAINPESYK